MRPICYVEITKMSKTIEHIGTIKNITPERVDVIIVQKSACSGCHLKSACSASDMSEKIIEVPNDGTNRSVGDEVTVVGTSRMGWEAVAYAFFIPFVIMMITLIAGLQMMDELSAGLIALGILMPYYLVLYLFRNKLKRKFVFYIK